MLGSLEQRRHEQVVHYARRVSYLLVASSIAVLLLRRFGALPPYSPLAGLGLAAAALALLGITRAAPGGGRIAASAAGVVALAVMVGTIAPEMIPAGYGLGWAGSVVLIAAGWSTLAAAFARPGAQPVALGIGGFIVAAVGAVSLFIRLSGSLQEFSARGFTAVTIFFAVGSILLGVAMLAVGWTDVRSPLAIPRWAPLAAAAAGVIASLVLWRTLALQEELAIETRTVQAAKARARSIEREVEHVGRVLLQFATFYRPGNLQPDQALTILRRDVPAADALVLVDSAGLPESVIPARALTAAVEATVPTRAMPRRGGQRPVAVLEIPGDTGHVVVHAAACTGQTCPGGVAAVINLGTINQVIAGRGGAEWTFNIGPPRMRPSRGGFHHSEPVQLGGLGWTLVARPTARALLTSRSGLPEVALLLGMISTAFLTVGVRLAAAAWDNARIVERIRIATAITRATDTVWEWDVLRGTLRRSGEIWRHLGYDPNAMAQTLVEWLDLVHPDDRERVTEEFLQVEDGPRDELDTEYRVRTTSGAWHMMVDRGRVIDRTDTRHPRHVMGITADVTASRLAERELRETEALSGIGRIAARVAHEINNPLGGIRSAFLLIKDAVPESHPHHRYVGAIEREIERIASVTRNLYDTYRPDDQDRGVSLSTIASDAAALLGEVNRTANVAIEVSLDGVPSVVPFGAGVLRQIVYNLVQNAVDASPIGGTVDLIGRTEAEALVIEVRDQGTGVPPELRRRIFEPFFTTKVASVHTSGLGLGLSMVRRSVAAVGGTIDVHDTPGGGATFVVRLPLSSQGVTA